MTLVEFVETTFLPYQRRRGAEGALDPGTVTTSETYLDAYVLPRIGHIRLRDLKATDIDQFNDDLLKSGRVRGHGGLAPETVRNVAQVVNQVLTYAVKKGVIVSNPCELTDAISVPTSKAETWTWDQLQRFMGHPSVESDRLGALWLMCAELGMRRSEILGLRSDAIVMEQAALKVESKLTKHGFAEGAKTPSSLRTLPISETLVEWLQRRAGHQRTEQIQRDRRGPTISVWCSPTRSAIH